VPQTVYPLKVKIASSPQSDIDRTTVGLNEPPSLIAAAALRS
jgi:hypothetical protein